MPITFVAVSGSIELHLSMSFSHQINSISGELFGIFPIFRPSEFLQHILKTMTDDPINSNGHWRLEVTACPFCSIKFTVIGKLEEMNEDSVYLMHKANIFDLIDLKLHNNPSDQYVQNTKKTLSKEALFWSEVDIQLALDLYKVYKLDFDTFFYDPEQYLSDIGLVKLSQQLKVLLQQ